MRKMEVGDVFGGGLTDLAVECYKDKDLSVVLTELVLECFWDVEKLVPDMAPLTKRDVINRIEKLAWDAVRAGR